jgi:hypothetical protein
MVLKSVRLIFWACTAALITGCHTVAYNPSYIRPVAQTVEPRYPGKVLIFTTPAEDKFVFQGHPNSFTGCTWSLHVPFGEITKKTSGEIYGHLFQAGYETGNVVENRFAVTIHPRIEGFAWRMNQLKNAGFAITPQVKMTLNLELMGADKSVLLRRQYESGWVDGSSYVINFSPFDSVSVVIHKTLANLMVDSIRDLDATIRTSVSPPPMPRTFSLKDEGMPGCIGFWSAWSATMAARSNPVSQCQPWFYQPSQISNPVYTERRLIDTRIDGDFNGWEGSTTWVMDNGQIWQQEQYCYYYHYASHPKVIIYPSDNKWFMRVEGVDKQLQVQRIK